ncbi:MAG TPA: SIR2 family protein, partial [Pyrinomonadaceae bacterium]|nr:SIR2 family protein [Pyrinomonadaceae bacterium]
MPNRFTASASAVGAPSIPVDVRFFDLQTGEGGIPFDEFSVLKSTGLEGKEVGISGVTLVSSDYFQITFDDYIPIELWPKTEIYLNDKRADRILKMEERSFIVAAPPGLRSSSEFNVFARVGNKETSRFVYNRYAQPSPSPSPTPTVAQEIPVSQSLTWLWFVLAGVLAVAAISVLQWYLNKRSKSSTSPTPPTPVTEVTSEKIDLPEELPEALVDACIKGECVLYAGAGLGAQSGLPTWGDFIWQLLKWAQDNGFINEAEASDYRLEVVQGQADPVADSVVSRLTTEQQQAALNDFLQEVFLKRVSPSALHEQIEKIKFSAILTANFDTLLETVYDVKSDDIYTPKDSDKLLAALTRRAFFILKLYGRLDKKETVIVAPAQYEDAITDNSLFSQFMQTLFFSRTLLFVGASIEGIESYLKGISLPKEVARTHYAIVAVTNQGAWKAKAELLERRYGIQVLPYTPSNDYAELKTFLEKLTEAVSTGRVAPVGGTQKVSRLQRVILQNIGPFEYLNLELDLSFEHKWHIFLGDNGVGKSTVLKAIALALCGKEAQAYAGRLLRDRRSSKEEPAQESTGTITLETDNKTSYVTTLRRNPRGDVELSSTTARPLEAEGWLAVAFPPLRTTSWDP